MSDMIEPWLHEIVRQRQEERLAAGAQARLARDTGGLTQRANVPHRLAGLVFGLTRAYAPAAHTGYPAGTDAGASS
jgi:hypothetical protein